MAWDYPAHCSSHWSRLPISGIITQVLTKLSTCKTRRRYIMQAVIRCGSQPIRTVVFPRHHHYGGKFVVLKREKPQYYHGCFIL